ncbi:hypothetical protein FC70_GL001350 [Paucilactobacillus oligofermentans DSM 15707 = LMG 22743]|uniref:Accessory Sec system protein Asp1 n=1 Tax=Paucilactobacillus oligofermentans DSM 15707 = LMG 22743 TaxID=1423778 RepID=A0A0R1RFA1_9LACO|nr:hypothetical protein FC70_GL001350 [Paucilactobacillus oligofermentans DSM 15707 = LMG 22743]
MLVVQSTPNLRHHLQNAGLIGIPSWNAFDWIQNIQVDESVPYGVEDLVFPKNALPSYRGDAVRYYLDGKLFATVNLRGEGYVWNVEYPVYDGEKLVEQYDDRGFLSTRIWYAEDETVHRQEWYNFNGDLVMQQEPDSTVLISIRLQEQLGHANFANLTQVIAQVTNTYLKEQGIDTVVGELTNDLAALREKLDQVKKGIFLMNQMAVTSAKLKLVQPNDLLIVPTEVDHERFDRYLDSDKSISNLNQQLLTIPTQTTQLNLGISNEIPLMEINWLTADAPVSFVDKAYSKIMPILARDEDKSLHVSVQDDGEAERLQSILEAWITSEFGVDLNSQEFSDLKKYLLAKEKERVTVDMEKKMEQRKKLPSWQPMVNAYMMLKRVVHEETPSLSGMEQQLQRARVFIDSSVKPITAYQILAVSAAIPQINRAQSDYLVNGKNGKVVADESQMVNAISNYLDVLSNWNKVVVFDAQLIETNSEDEIFSHWQEVL